METKCKCVHDIIFIDEVLDEKTETFELRCRCLLCGKLLSYEDLDEFSPEYILTSDVILKDGSRSTISYDLLTRSAKKIKEKYYMFTGQEIPIDTLYSLLIDYFRISD